MDEKNITHNAVEEARNFGIDISLLTANLKRTPTDRIQRLQEWLELYDELNKARTKRTNLSSKRF